MIYTLTLSPAIDHIMCLEQAVLGDINRAQQEWVRPGGKGINVSVVLTRLGVPNVAWGLLAGTTGRLLEELLREEGIAQDFISLSAGNTRINVKLCAAEETAINGLPPAVSTAEWDQLQQRVDGLAPGDILMMGGAVPSSMPYDVYAQLVMRAHARGAHTVVDTSGRALEAVLAAGPDLIKPNHHELGALFGKTPETMQDILLQARQAQKRGARAVLVSCGEAGAVLLTAAGTVYRTDAPRGAVISTVGAGDSLLAGFVAARVRGLDAETALRYATAVGSAAAFTAWLPDRTEVERIFAAHSTSRNWTDRERSQ